MMNGLSGYIAVALKKYGLVLLRWTICIAWTVGSIFQFSQAMETSNSWLEFVAPFLIWAIVVVGLIFLGRFPIVLWSILVLAALCTLGWLLSVIGGNWHAVFIDNWYITLMIAYLPIMLIVWFGYRKWPRRKHD